MNFKPLYILLTLTLAGVAVAPASKVQDGDKKDGDKKYEVKLDLPPYTGPKKRLAVMDLEVKVTATATTNPTPAGGTTTTASVSAPTNTDFGTGLTEMLTTSLVDSNRFVVLERKTLADIQAEQALGAGGTVDPNAVTKAGSILGAQAIIRGAVTEFSYSSSSQGSNGILGNVLNVQHSSNTAKVVLDVRIVDASTTQVLFSVKGVGSVKSSANGVNIDFKEVQLGSNSFESSPLGEATRKAIASCVKQICDKMEKMPWEARIADMETDGSAIYLNAGGSMGVKVGDEFEVLHPGRAIMDPETNLVIGRTKDSVVGRVKVDSVTEKLAIAKVVSGTGFAKGDVVHFASP